MKETLITAEAEDLNPLIISLKEELTNFSKTLIRRMARAIDRVMIKDRSVREVKRDLQMNIKFSFKPDLNYLGQACDIVAMPYLRTKISGGFKKPRI